MTKRIEWIDIAKGMAIILMVISHTIPNNHFMTLIFSFHMPLFIILSGYTYKLPKNKSDLLYRFKKYVKRLFVPYIITLLICSFITFLKSNVWAFGNFIKFLVKNFIWGNGADYTFLGIRFVNVGPIWFLITLFFSKIIFDLINYKFSNKGVNFNIILYSFFLLGGIEIGLSSWLPQCLDLVFVFLFYLYIGYLFKKYYSKIKINKALLFIIAFTIWGLCLGININIELAVRKYPFGILSVIESLCASYCIIELCKTFDNTKFINLILTSIGKISLTILCIHSIEFFLIDWKSLNINIYLISLMRVMTVLLVSLLFNNMITKITSLKKKKIIKKGA